MTVFSHGSITQIPTTKDDVYAFAIAGHVEDDDTEEMAKFMNQAFDKPGKVSMLLDLSGMTGSDLDAMFDGHVLRAQFRAWKEVDKYAVIGAPDRAAKIIDWMDNLIPVDARAFEAKDAQMAWSFVGAEAVAPETTTGTA
ncbi:MAG: STAS/SEC14 domain-containing protein [Pseudomonadota bacterium]